MVKWGGVGFIFLELQCDKVKRLYSTEAHRTLDQHDAVVELVTHSYSEWPTDLRTSVRRYLTTVTS